MNQTAQQLFDKLVSYQFTATSGKPWSHVALFKEYTRRTAWWADTLGVANGWLTMNIAYILELDEGLDDEPFQKLDTHLQSQKLEQPMPALLQSALMFATVMDNQIIKDYNLPNPYDAIVKLYLRGGFIRWNQRGFWEVSGAFGVGGIDIATYRVSKAFVSLDDEELDLLDSDDTESSVPNL